MNRYDFYNTNTINKLMYVYNLYKMMEEKYKESIENGQYYNFMFYNYKGLGLDVCMRGDGFYVYDSDAAPDDGAMFSIRRTEDYNIEFYDSIVCNDYFCYKGGWDFSIVVGDSIDYKTNRVLVDSYADVEDILLERPEEWFFQQMTVQNIVEYEQFQKEIDFCFEFYKRINDNEIIIEVSDLSTFNLDVLDGFIII